MSDALSDRYDGAPPIHRFRHGVDCPKVAHVGQGYLHADDYDGSYDVDGVSYCGRCHGWMGTPVSADEARRSRMREAGWTCTTIVRINSTEARCTRPYDHAGQHVFEYKP